MRFHFPTASPFPESRSSLSKICFQALFCLDRALEVATASRTLKLNRAECLAYLGRYAEAQEVQKRY